MAYKYYITDSISDCEGDLRDDDLLGSFDSGTLVWLALPKLGDSASCP